jgi:hypothetical protein
MLRIPPAVVIVSVEGWEVGCWLSLPGRGVRVRVEQDARLFAQRPVIEECNTSAIYGKPL